MKKSASTVSEKHCKVKKLDFLDIPKNRAEFHYGRADKLLKEGKNTTLELERICIELTRACSLKPREVKNFLGLAECFRRACDSSSAIFSLRFALQLHPNSTYVKQQLGELLINRAQELMKLGKHYSKASKYFEEALSLDSSGDNIWMLRCVCEVHCKQFERALLCINRTINLSTEESIDSYVLRAKIHWAMGNMDIGNKDLRKAMTIDKEHPEVKAFICRSFEEAKSLYNEGIELFTKGDIQGAITCCENALVINNEDVKLYLVLSKMHRQKGDLNEAFRYLKDAEKQYRKGDPYSAFPIQKLPFEISRQQNLVINEMAMKEAVAGDCEKAIILLNKAIASERKINEDPADIPFIYFMNRGDCYRSLNEALFAIADYKLALERSPDNWDITTKLSMSHYLLAVDYFNSSDYTACYEQISGAIQLYNDKVPEYYCIRGKALYFQGHYHEAYLDFKTVLEKSPNNTEVLKFMRQFETPPERESENSGGGDLFVGVKPRPVVSNNVHAHRGGPMTDTRSSRVKLKPSSVAIVADPLGVNTDYVRLDKWKSLPNGAQLDLQAPMDVSPCTSMLPVVNPYLAAAVVYNDAAKGRLNELNKTLHSRTSVKESNLWSLMREAEKTGREQRKAKNEKEAGMTESEKLARKTKNVPPSSTALKKRSQERSRKALENPVIAGVVSSYMDPLLVAERSKRKGRGSGISVGSGGGGGSGDGGGGSKRSGGGWGGESSGRRSSILLSSHKSKGSSQGGSKSKSSLKSKRTSMDTSLLSEASLKVHQKEVTDHLLTPTVAYTHHHDTDELHAHKETASQRAEDYEARKMKPYMQVKRERTLTEFLLSPSITSDTNPKPSSMVIEEHNDEESGSESEHF